MKNHLLKNRDLIFIWLFLLWGRTPPVQAEWVLPDNQGLPTSFDAGVVNLTNWLIGFVATISVLALIWGGVRYTTASGSQDHAEGAKKTIQYAIMGLAVAGLAYAFVHTIITEVLI